MKKNDEEIKKALQNNIQHIDDPSFADRIVSRHLANKRVDETYAFANFLPIVVGLSIVFLSVGIVAVIRQNNQAASEIGFTETHGLIIFMTSFIFLTHKLLDEVIAPNTHIRHRKT